MVWGGGAICTMQRNIYRKEKKEKNTFLTNKEVKTETSCKFYTSSPPPPNTKKIYIQILKEKKKKRKKHF